MTNLIEDIEYLLCIKFLQIQLSGYISADSDHNCYLCFLISLKTQIRRRRGCRVLVSFQVSSNSVKLLLRRKRKCLSPSEARAAIFVLRSVWKRKLGRWRWVIATCRVYQICFSRCWGEVENVSASLRSGFCLFFCAPEPSSVRLSVVVNFLHFRLLLWNHWMEFEETLQEGRSQHPLPSLCFSGRSEKQDGRPGLWLAETFSTSPLKPLNGIQRNLTGSQRPLLSLCFSGRSEKQDGHPGLWLAETFSTSSLKPLNGIQRNLTGSKISKSSTKFVFFRPIGKIRWPPCPIR